MRALRLVLIVGALAVPVAACRKSEQPPDQNIITNEIPANADIEALPPDESVDTSSNELINGADNADVGDLNASNHAD